VTRGAAALLAVCLTCAVAPAPAFGHAVLQGTEPTAGTVLKRQPQQLVFRFSEPVEGSFGAIKVLRPTGSPVEAGEAFHPGGRNERLGVRLRPGLPKGTYTATYRVISADGHPVAGGLVFSVGKATKPGASVSEALAAEGSTGPPTDIGFGVARALQYGSIALAIGAIAFLFFVWVPGLTKVAGGDARWLAASEAFSGRLRAVMLGAAAVGIVSGVLGVVFQGAVASGLSFWSALDQQVVSDVLDTKFGTVWGLRSLVWMAFAAAVLLTFGTDRRPVLRSASVGATGLAVQSRPLGLLGIPALVLPLALLAASPAFSGHASLQHPAALVVSANIAHVAAVSLWVGGLATLLFVLPAATRKLELPDRARLLAANLSRFSTIAGVAVAVLLAAGIVQAIVEVGPLEDLVDTAFGRSVLIKFLILIGPLIALGAYNRKRSVPRLERIAANGESAGKAGLLLRRALRFEVALVVVMLGVTAALVSYPPSVSTAAGPVAVTERIGPADGQLTVDPARIGPNVMHIYLTNARDGSPYDRTKELGVRLSLPEEDLGPIRQPARKAGPGHFVMDGAVFGVAGDWEVAMEARVSDFDAHYTTFEVPIR
jgi:copper transport protein